MYNRYIGNTGRHYKVDEPRSKPAPAPTAQRKATPPNEPPRKNAGTLRPTAPKKTFQLSEILPKNLDTGDILLLLMLYLLYSDSGDDEFLIIMAVLFFTS